jgi:biopolymer transport protein ExbD
LQFKEKRKKSLGINITSLIDVMFILLIFFMVTSSFIEQPGVKLELPESKANEVTQVENIVLFISKEGRVYLNEESVSIDSLSDILEEKLPNVKDNSIVLKADKASEHGLVVEIMDIAKQSGFKKIVIGTQPKRN